MATVLASCVSEYCTSIRLVQVGSNICLAASSHLCHRHSISSPRPSVTCHIPSRPSSSCTISRQLLHTASTPSRRHESYELPDLPPSLTRKKPSEATKIKRRLSPIDPRKEPAFHTQNSPPRPDPIVQASRLLLLEYKGHHGGSLQPGLPQSAATSHPRSRPRSRPRP